MSPACVLHKAYAAWGHRRLPDMRDVSAVLIRAARAARHPRWAARWSVGVAESPEIGTSGRERATTRLMQFSDGVFTIAATILVLEIQRPADAAHLSRELLELWPSYLAYALTFPADRAGLSQPSRHVRQYREHVTASLDISPWARIIKTSDFTDNGVGLIHTTGPRIAYLASKYAPLVLVLREMISRPDTPLCELARQRILAQLDQSEERFDPILPTGQHRQDHQQVP